MPNEWGKKRDCPTFTDFEIGDSTIRMRGDAYPWLRGFACAGATLLITGLFMMLTTPRLRDKV
jgi:hypothetical protein